MITKRETPLYAWSEEALQLGASAEEADHSLAEEVGLVVTLDQPIGVRDRDLGPRIRNEPRLIDPQVM